jgi:hypothetical protein
MSWIALPLLALTIMMLLAGSANGGFWAWWGVGVLYLSVPLLGWFVGASIGFAEALRRMPG